MVIGVNSDLKFIGLKWTENMISFMSPKGFTDFIRGPRQGFVSLGLNIYPASEKTMGLSVIINLL